MKNYPIICLAVLGCWIFCSCSEKINLLYEEPSCSSNYRIPIDEALSSLDEFMATQGMIETKGQSQKYIDNYFAIGSSINTKAVVTDSLLYAVNFKDGQGYALLSADKRISDDIIAITTQGSVSKDDFSDDGLTLSPGEDDDLSEDKYYELVDSGVLAVNTTQINKECLRYAIHEARTFREDENPGSTTGGSSGTATTITRKWVTASSVPMLMNTVWTQEGVNNVFNKYCPMVGLRLNKKAPAGCVCIAMSQIIAYNEFPDELCCNGVDIDYHSIKEIYKYENDCFTQGLDDGTERSQEMLSQFIINVGGWCNTKYHACFGYTWGFAWPWDGRDCLSTFGYKNVSLNWGYDEDTVIESLNNGCPVFMSAIAKLVSGHAWVIDGYIKRNYTSNTGVISNQQTLVHCNWGWGGNCNGYFTSGVFKTDSAVIRDEDLSHSMKEKYWYAFNTITYDKPIK